MHSAPSRPPVLHTVDALGQLARRGHRSSRRPGLGRLKTLTAALLALGLLHPVGAATWQWTGATSANWSQAANWLQGVPVGGADTELLLDAPGRASSFNDLAGGLLLNRLTLGAQAASPVISGQALMFDGADARLRVLTSSGHAQVQTALQLRSDLTVEAGRDYNRQLFLGGAISGSGGLSFSSGIALMYGSNSYTGATTVASGAVLGVAGTALSATSGVTVQSGAELQIVSSSGVTTLSQPITLAGTLSSSARQVDSVLGPQVGSRISGPITLAGDAALISFGGSGSGLNAVVLQVGAAIDRAGHALALTAEGRFDSLLLGSLAGDGDVLLQSGGGRLSVAAIGGLGDVQVSGGAGVQIGSLSGGGRLRVALDETFTTASLTGSITGQRDIEVQRGSLLLQGPGQTGHSFSGQIVLHDGGTLQLGRESYLGTASPTLRFEGGGRLQFTDGGFGMLRDVQTHGGVAAVVFGGGSNLVSGSISGSGGLALGGGIIQLSGHNSFAGGLEVFDGGIVQFADDASLGQAGGRITLGGGLVLPDGYELSRPLTVLDGHANISGSGTHVISSAIDGDGLLTLGGAARYVLTGPVSHSGGIALAGESSGQAAVLVLDSDARLGAPGGVLNIGRQAGNNALITLPGTLVAAGDLEIAATRSTQFRGMTVDTNGFNVVFNQPISGLGMTKTGLGSWTLNTANTDGSGSNAVDIRQGRLVLGVDQALGQRSMVQLAAAAELDLAGHALSVTSLDSQAGSVLQLGAAGTARLAPLFGELAGSLQGTGTLVVGRAGFVPGSVSLNAANSFVGAIEVSQGSRLTVGHLQALGASGNALRLDNGRLATAASLGAPLVIGNDVALQIGSGGAVFEALDQSLIIERALAGTAPLGIGGGSGPGDAGPKFDVRLAHAANSFVSDLRVGDAGFNGFGDAALGIVADGSLGDAGNRVILGHSFYDGESTRSARGGLRAWAKLSLAASRSLLLDGRSDQQGPGDANWIDTNGHDVTLLGGIGELQAGMALLKVGEGRLVMNGIHTYTGTTFVQQGSLGGAGELQALQLQDAVLAPGDGIGLLTLRGDLQLTGGAALWLELGEADHDRLAIGGLLDLGDGSLLRLDGLGDFGSGWTADQRLVVVDAGVEVSGQFANVVDGGRLSLADGRGSLAVHYGSGQGLWLDDYQAAAPVPEPASWALMLLGALGLAAMLRTSGPHGRSGSSAAA